MKLHINNTNKIPENKIFKNNNFYYLKKTLIVSIKFCKYKNIIKVVK